ncbi:hypothetical protein [Microbacterium indicum]|uniref:hypothetical protein n=1 Tax=Microbacterium indicum TaxID=358100 RepID=UPI00041D55DC|nr:hypothetical protein [Microbacterium indicum]
MTGSHRRRRGALLGVIAAAGAVAVVVGGFSAVQAIRLVVAEGAYSSAVDDYDAAAASYAAAYDALAAGPQGDDAQASSEPAVLLGVADAARPFAGSAVFDDALLQRVADAAAPVAALADGEERTDPADVAGAGPCACETIAEYRAGAADVATATEDLDAQTASLTDALDGLSDAVPPLDAAVAALVADLPAAADRVERGSISSRAPTRIAMQDAAAGAAEADAASLAGAVAQYAAAAQDVVESQAAELAEKQRGDGLYEARLAVEEFVRGIVGATRVDFDWSPLVNGLGEGVSAGGYTTWWYDDGGYSTMELSDSVAAYWPDERFQGLVVHESGHAITSQCRSLLDDAFDGDVELMATAWAIGMGYTNPWGNGVDYYYGGRAPDQDLVDATLSCR